MADCLKGAAGASEHTGLEKMEIIIDQAELPAKDLTES